MIISIAQTKPQKNKIEVNIQEQIELIEKASESDLIIFPELSIQGYHAKTAESFALSIDDTRLNIFKTLSKKYDLIIATSFPLKTNDKPFISLVFYFPNGEIEIYNKRYLHESEKPFFTNGEEEVYIEFNDLKIAPAICYEVSVAEHSEKAAKENCNVYLTSVAKNKESIERNLLKLQQIAKKYKMFVFMSNQVGDCDDDIAWGNSCVISSEGQIVDQLNEIETGIISYKTN